MSLRKAKFEYSVEAADPSAPVVAEVPKDTKKATKEFEKGDPVMISPKSMYYFENSVSNPRDTMGVVTRVSGSEIRVEWENGRTNAYRKGDLVLAETYKNNKETLEKIIKNLELFPNIDNIVGNQYIFSVEDLANMESFKDLGMEEQDVLQILLGYSVLLKRLLEERELYKALFNVKDLFSEELITFERAKELLEGNSTSESSPNPSEIFKEMATKFYTSSGEEVHTIAISEDYPDGYQEEEEWVDEEDREYLEEDEASW